MESLLTYILQINLLFIVVFLGYWMLLKRLTFYQLNRAYLLVGVLYALVYPFVDISSLFRAEVPIRLPLMLEYIDVYITEESSPVFRLIDLMVAGIGVGSLVFLVKLLLQFFSLLNVHRHSKPSKWGVYFFQNVIFPIVPFSFFNKIYVHEGQHVDAELNNIFKHECIHVKGLHTVDIVLFEILLVGCWYNPFVWLMRKAVRQNLEFLTDQQVLDKGVDRQTYQYSLLNVTAHGTAVGIGSQFNFKTLKKRIMMMNKRRSSKRQMSKYVFLLPVMILVGATLTANKAQTNIDKAVLKAQETKLIQEEASTAYFDGNFEGQGSEKKHIRTSAIDSNKRDEAYPLLHPSFDRKQLEGKNLYYQIDGKLVTLDEFLAFPRTEIYAVDIYKESGEIFRKIGKQNADGLFVVTSKKHKDSASIVPNGKEGLMVTGELPANVDSPIDLKNLPSAGPLFIVDGEIMEPGSDFTSLNPDDIESVSILKDKFATDIYGERGKNGAIEIVMKKQKSEDTETILK